LIFQYDPQQTQKSQLPFYFIEIIECSLMLSGVSAILLILADYKSYLLIPFFDLV